MTKAMTAEQLEAVRAADRAAAAKYPSLVANAIVVAKNGKTYRVAGGSAYVNADGKIQVTVKGQKNGKDFGPYRYMLAESF